MLSQVVAAGGVGMGDPREESGGDYRAEYRGFRLWWAQWGTVLHVARIEGFDRWANSRIHKGEAPPSLEELDALLDILTHSTVDPRALAFDVAARALADHEARRQ